MNTGLCCAAAICTVILARVDWPAEARKAQEALAAAALAGAGGAGRGGRGGARRQRWRQPRAAPPW